MGRIKNYPKLIKQNLSQIQKKINKILRLLVSHYCELRNGLYYVTPGFDYVTIGADFVIKDYQ
jgi:hypothetical protein